MIARDIIEQKEKEMSNLDFSLIQKAYDNIIDAGSVDHPYKGIDENFFEGLREEEQTYIRNAAEVINAAWMIYTADSFFELDRDAKRYNELASKFNEKYETVFVSYPTQTHLSWNNLFPENASIPCIILFK